MRTMVFAAAALAAAWSLPALAAEPTGALSGDEIKAYFPGKRIYGTTPSGKGFMIDFRADGTFTGIVEKGTDVGKWWVERNTLCRSWTAWVNQQVGHSKTQACFWVVLDHTAKRVNYYNMNGSLYRSWRMN